MRIYYSQNIHAHIRIGTGHSYVTDRFRIDFPFYVYINIICGEGGGGEDSTRTKNKNNSLCSSLYILNELICKNVYMFMAMSGT